MPTFLSSRLRTSLLITSLFASLPFAQIGLCCEPAHDDALKTMPQADAAYLSKHLPGVVVGPVKDIAPLERAEEWYPMELLEFEYDRSVDSDKEAMLVLERVERAPGAKVGEKKEGWAMKLPNKTVRYLQHDEKTGIVTPTDVSHSYGLIIRLDPPEPIIHENVKIGQSVKRKIDVGIYDLHQPTNKSHSGQVDCTWTDLGGWRVQVPMGTYDTHLIRIEYNGSIGPASVQAKKYMFIAKDVGPVAFTDSREISAFIFYNNDTDHSGVLKSLKRSASKPQSTGKSG